MPGIDGSFGADGGNLYVVQIDSLFTDEEVARLPIMDKWLLEPTAESLGRHSLDNVLEIGAGSSPSVGDIVTRAGGVYTPSDANPEMVAAQTEMGREAILAKADSIPFEDGEFSLTTSRAMLGWVADEAERRAAIEEHLRTGEGTVIMNFDWSTVKGGPQLAGLKELLVPVLQQAGFDAVYGKEAQEHEVNDVVSGTREVETHEYTHVDVDGTYSEVVTSAASSVVAAAAAMGRQDIADAIEAQIDPVREEMLSGDHETTLPALVATHVF